MTKNLLTDHWLRVNQALKVKNEGILVSEMGNASFTDLYAPRADFKGALYQFLIGVLQTAFAPEDRKEWLKYWKQPPTETELSAAFFPYVEAFNLDAENGKPAFMQDLDLPEGSENTISGLLIEAPGENTLKNNQDHFIKRGGVEQISPYWAAIALFTLQINAPSGGQGHRVSLRGGGPLTTLLLPPDKPEFNTLWHHLWLNVLTKDELFDLQGNSSLEGLATIFPWMGKTRISKDKGSETYPQHGHPLQMYWSMPRRIRLHWGGDAGICDISGEASDSLVKSYHTQNYGVNYAGTWTHPLTPYVSETGKEPYSIKAQPGGLGYRHWLELAAVNEEGSKRRSATLMVQKYRDSRQGWIKGEFEPRLWAFGYDMDNMKARCWYEATMPLFNLDEEYLDDVQELAKRMVNAATDVLKTLKSALKMAWFKRPKDAKGDLSFIDANFWSITEDQFYQLLGQQIDAVKNDDEEKMKASSISWKKILEVSAFDLFDQYALSNLNEDGDYGRVVQARDCKGGLKHYLTTSKALKALAA